MRQPQDPDDYDEDLDRYDDEDEQLGRPVYQGTGLTVRELNAEELQRFLDANVGQPAQLLGSGWAALDPLEHPSRVPGPPGPDRGGAGRGHRWPREPRPLGLGRVPPPARAGAGRLDP
jgi:hypothetical protein